MHWLQDLKLLHAGIWAACRLGNNKRDNGGMLYRATDDYKGRCGIVVAWFEKQNFVALRLVSLFFNYGLSLNTKKFFM